MTPYDRAVLRPILRKKPTPARDVLVAAYRWFNAGRPLSSTNADHLDNPTINRTGSLPERELAAAVGAWVRDLERRAADRVVAAAVEHTDH